MGGRVNHRGWIVLESVGSHDAGHCVDFFEDPDGGFGFEHLRADPEDGGRWTAVGGFSSARYETALAAAAAAGEAVGWLRDDAVARRSFHQWTTSLGSRRS